MPTKLFFGSLIALSLFLVAAPRPVVAENVLTPGSEPICLCNFYYQKKLLVPAGSDVPAADGPKFGYSDLKSACSFGASGLKAFGNLVATDVDAAGTMCGAHCATGLGTKCPEGKQCKHDKDCINDSVSGVQLLCEYGSCVNDGVFLSSGDEISHKTSYDVDSDASIVKSYQCTDIQKAKTEYGSDVDNQLPCGGYCAAYYGKTCPIGKKCKVNEDCASKICNAPADPDNELGECAAAAEQPGGNTEQAKYWTETKYASFSPYDIDSSLPQIADADSCDKAAAKHPNVISPDLKIDEGEKFLQTTCVVVATPVTPPPPAPAAFKNIPFTLPSAAALNQIGTTDARILLGRAIKTIMGIMGSIALAMFIYGGILYMIAAGNSDRQTKGKEVLMWSTLGVVVILSSYALLSLVFEVFS